VINGSEINLCGISIAKNKLATGPFPILKKIAAFFALLVEWREGKQHITPT